MRPTAALAGGIACALLAVAVVAADLAWNVEATLERLENGSWVVVARSPDGEGERFPVASACAGREFRLTLQNGHPWGSTVRVSATIDGRALEGWTPHDWNLGSGESVTRALTVPASALSPQTGPDRKLSANLEVRVGDQFLWACVGEAA